MPKTFQLEPPIHKTIVTYLAYGVFPLLLLLWSNLAADSTLNDICEEGIVVNLREPEYYDGTLTTDKGGVVTGPRFRMQAQRIKYTKQVIEGEEIQKIEASGDLMLEYGENVFVGDFLEYDFTHRSGVILNGRTMHEPWFLGGERIELLADRSFIIYNGFISTCENQNSEWQIRSSKAHIGCDNILSAENIQFRFVKVPIFWVPSFCANIESLFHAPVTYRLSGGGHQGPRLTVRYRLFDVGEYWRTFLRVDLGLRNGLGGGIETHYLSPDRNTTFFSRNYIAKDRSIFKPEQDFRYRFQGSLKSTHDDGKLTALLTYDKLSDEDMATDYHDRDFNLRTAERTEFLLRREEDYWIANFDMRLRLNSFQSVKQEIPNVGVSIKPLSLGDTGIIADNRVSMGYLDYQFAKDISDASDYNAVRGEISTRLYRPFHLSPVTFTPEAGLTCIHYGNSPLGDNQEVIVGVLGFELNSHLFRQEICAKHVLTPYLRFQTITTPRISPDEHYIFDINDGWAGLNLLTYGLESMVLKKDEDGDIYEYLLVDIWAHSFLNSHTVPQTIPKLYGKTIWNPSKRMTIRFDTSLDLVRETINASNLRAEWTLSDDIAIASEYRYRGHYDWRKADRQNFNLEAFRPEDFLVASPLSDKRNTFLMDIFYRHNPVWSLGFQSRHGWGRNNDPDYNEFEVSFNTVLSCAWRFRITFQHQEHDDRFAMHISLHEPRPKCQPLYIPTWSR